MSIVIPRDAEGKILDFLDPETRLDPKPEEFVRQRMLRVLHEEYGYAKSVLAREVPIQHGSKDALDSFGRPVRADIVVYETAGATKARDQGRIRLIVECKAPNQDGGYNQLCSYIFLTSADGGVWFNGSGTDAEIAYFRRTRHNKLVPWVGLPRPGESWDALGRRSKNDLNRPKDIKGLLRRCHNKLHARGAASDEEDLTLDMVRILMAKAIDEMSDGNLPQFYCTPEEYQSEAGRQTSAARVRSLFDQAKLLYPGVFRAEERITVDDRAICDVVGELQSFRLLSDDAVSDEWDVMGHAYEEYTAVSLKRKRGQFFTNRLVVDLLVRLCDPQYNDLVLDPAGGSAGFLSGSLRYVRRLIAKADIRPEIGRKRLETFRQRLFMVEISHRLVKVAKTAMILHGDGHTGMTQGDALGPIDRLNPMLLTACGPGKPTVILTNPPFAGVGDGRITDARVLELFECGHRWVEKGGTYQQTAEVVSDGAPPEMLFFERCIEWLAPNGRLGIVVPKSFLDTSTYRPARTILFRDCQLLAVVTCHKNTFQPHTGVRTALVVVRKRPSPSTIVADDPPIFMAISRAVGQDSEGVPIFARDATGTITEAVDEDLSQIASGWDAHRNGSLVASEYRFSVPGSSLDANLNINPQAHRPSLNATIEAIEALDDTQEWSVSQLDEIAESIEVFKGPRLKSENLIVDVDDAGRPGVEPYYTPSAVLQERRDAAKFLDTSRASKSQAATIAAIRVRRGDIVITRSGTIGRIAIVTTMFDGAIVSDDLIRVRVPDERLRLFLWGYLESKLAQDQIMRNEYGAIQQHLEPEHVRSILVPIPADAAKLDDLVKARRQILETKESNQRAVETSDSAVRSLFAGVLAEE
jgi:type I restriction-modification system DNA methylase subunit